MTFERRACIAVAIALLLPVALAEVSELVGDPACLPEDPGAAVGAGCPCNPYYDAAVGNGPGCGAGLACAVQRDSRGGPVPGSRYSCQQCALGQLCPEGTRLPALQGAAYQEAVHSLSCPPGRYCPSPAASIPCPPGTFCARGSVAPVTCDLRALLALAPTFPLPRAEVDVREGVLRDGSALAGNTCPGESGTPLRSCPAGSYCPTTQKRLPCPAGHFCRAGSAAPGRCPPLTSCPPGSAVPTRSWSGVVVLAATAAVMAAFAAALRGALLRSRERAARRYHAQDRLWRLVHPLFKGGDGESGGNSIAVFPGNDADDDAGATPGTATSSAIAVKGTLRDVWPVPEAGGGDGAPRTGDRWAAGAGELALAGGAALGPPGATPPSARRRSDVGSLRNFRAIRPRLTVQFHGLGLTLRDGRSLLRGVTGAFRHSRVSAIMGPSGAGKSTLLGVLMGDPWLLPSGCRISGSVRVNGRRLAPGELAGVRGYVPQDDVVHADLTVRENLDWSASLRLSSSKPAAEREAIVEDALDALSLRVCAHQLVGGGDEARGVSGGQRKRVSIGLELVAKPSLLFMDEPTSGLDATAAADVLGALKRAASLGMNVVAVLHQPRAAVFALFDDLALLGAGGRLVYLGPGRYALDYFSSLGFSLPRFENPADFFLDVVSGSVTCETDPNFHPHSLIDAWSSGGTSWICARARAEHDRPASDDHPGARAAAAAVAHASAPAPSAPQHQRQGGGGMDAEQLGLLLEAFAEADVDRVGSLGPAQLEDLLRALGLSPDEADLAAAVGELADTKTGRVSRETLVSYVLSGGTARPAAAAAPGAAYGAGVRAPWQGAKAVRLQRAQLEAETSTESMLSDWGEASMAALGCAPARLGSERPPPADSQPGEGTPVGAARRGPAAVRVAHGPSPLGIPVRQGKPVRPRGGQAAHSLHRLYSIEHPVGKAPEGIDIACDPFWSQSAADLLLGASSGRALGGSRSDGVADSPDREADLAWVRGERLALAPPASAGAPAVAVAAEAAPTGAGPPSPAGGSALRRRTSTALGARDDVLRVGTGRHPSGVVLVAVESSGSAADMGIPAHREIEDGGLDDDEGSWSGSGVEEGDDVEGPPLPLRRGFIAESLARAARRDTGNGAFGRAGQAANADGAARDPPGLSPVASSLGSAFSVEAGGSSRLLAGHSGGRSDDPRHLGVAGGSVDSLGDRSSASWEGVGGARDGSGPGGAGAAATAVARRRRRRHRAPLRTQPGAAAQFLLLSCRGMLKAQRNWTTRVLDSLLLAFAGLVIGTIHGTQGTSADMRGHFALVFLTLGIICTCTGLSVFGRDRAMTWRERGVGVRTVPHWLAQSSVGLVDVVLAPLIFTSVYYSLTVPAIGLLRMYVVAAAVAWWTSGLGNLVSVVVPPSNALVAAVALVMIIGGFINGVSPPFRTLSAPIQHLTAISYNRWAVQAAIVWDFSRQPAWLAPQLRNIVFTAGQCGLHTIPLPESDDDTLSETYAGLPLNVREYCKGAAGRGLLFILAQGLALRLLTLIALAVCPRGISLEPLTLSVADAASAARALGRDLLGRCSPHRSRQVAKAT